MSQNEVILVSRREYKALLAEHRTAGSLPELAEHCDPKDSDFKERYANHNEAWEMADAVISAEGPEGWEDENSPS